MGACVAALTGALHAGADRAADVPMVEQRPEARPSIELVERAEPIRIRVQASTLRVPAPNPAVAPPAPTPQERPRVQERPERRDDGDARRNYRRRGYNRYPGPIPTPADWQPPEGPIRIGLQAGHWRADEAPRELEGLKGNGTRWESVAEWQANLEIARRAATMLEERGYVVDVLPAVVPPGYRAHLFISIHADGSNDPRASGYRVAAPRRDATGRADRAARLLEHRYGEATGLTQLPTVTRRMQNYYAFNFRRYEHALHPMTIGVILETGFLTSARDRRVIMDDPERAARGIVEAVTSFPETPPPSVAAGNQ
jgi:N-acetylmuramoyl-L-alanine amidase